MAKVQASAMTGLSRLAMRLNDAGGSVSQIGETLAKPPQIPASRGHFEARRHGALRIFGTLLRPVSRAGLARALAEEQAFGHAFLLIPVFLGAGAFCWFSLADPPGFAEIAFLLCIVVMAAVLLRHSGIVARLSSRLAAVGLAGMGLAAIETTRLETVILDTPVTTSIRGTVLGREMTDRGHWRYSVALDKTFEPVLRRPPDRVSLLSRSRGEPVAIGGVIEGRARLSPPSGPALAGLNDFAFDSYFKGVGAVGYFYGAPRMSAQAALPADRFVGVFPAWIVEAVARWREAIGTRIRTVIGGDAGAIAAALITAEERAISRDTIEALREAGLAHVLAISGLNMVLAAGTFLIGARTLLSLVPGLAHRVSIKKAAAAGALVMVFAYILISGGAVSAVRSWIMISIMLVAVFFDRPSISLRNVALSAIVILVVTPSAVTGPGFQMSFAATLALVAGYAHWRDRPQRERAPLAGGPRWLRAVSGFFAGLFLSSLIGGLSTMIYAAGHFHRLAAYGLAGNMLAMPVISILVMPFALVAMLLMPFGLDYYPLLVMGQGIEWMMETARLVAGWDGDIMTGRIQPAVILLVSLGGVLLCLFRTWLALCGLVPLAMGGLVLAVSAFDRPQVVIAEDGRLVAMIEDAVVATNRDRPPDFVFGQWQRALRLNGHRAPQRRDAFALNDAAAVTVATPTLAGTADRRPQKPPIDIARARRAMRDLLGEASKGRFLCAGREWCAATTRQGWTIITVEDVRFIGAACDTGDLVVTPVRLRFDTCRTGARLVSSRSLRRTGALEIYAGTEAPGDADGAAADMRVVSALGSALRPWQRHRRYDWRSGSFETPPWSP